MVNNQVQLRRQNGMFAGVCGGLGAFVGVNPFWFRLLFGALMIPGGFPGVLAYALAWFIIPSR